MAGEAIDDKKVKIGTVDSFQGMEFDVVFLSVVRTKSAVPNLAADRVRRARQLFGHLCLHNRLNVAMSRQKRLLVVAGDSALLESDLASEFIPSLVNFRDMAG
jgi:superfamily I DNA and/or RNA helicase